MKQLFGETFAENRTIWLQADVLDQLFLNGTYNLPEFQTQQTRSVIDQLSSQMIQDLKGKATEISQVNWIFYSELIMTDAREDEVRFTVLVQLKDGHFRVNLNLSDYLFATAFDELMDFQNNLRKTLEALANEH